MEQQAGRGNAASELTLSHVTMVGEGLERSTVVSTTAAPGSAGSWMMQAAWRAGLGPWRPLASYSSKAALGGSCTDDTA